MAAAGERSRFALIDALNAEWERIGRDNQLAGYGRAEVTRWAAQYPPLSRCRTPAEVLTAIGSDPDAVLLALIDIHQQAGPAQSIPGSSAAAPPANDRIIGQRPIRPGQPDRTAPRAAGEFAGRIVLQTMLGKLVTMARRDHRHAVEDYVGALWARVGSYPVTRRPSRVAANLALDTLKAVTRERPEPAVPMAVDQFDRIEHGQLVAWGLGRAVAVAPGGRPAEPADDLTAHRVLRIARELALIDEPTRRLLLSVYADGMSSGQAAEKFGLSPTTVRFRCSRAVRRMARHAAAISSAA